MSNGGGIFALGCIDRVPRRKYHSLFSLAEGIGTHASARNLLLDLVEIVTSPKGTTPLADPRARVKVDAVFSPVPNPTWTYDFGFAVLTRTIEAPQLDAFPQATLPHINVHYRLTPKSDVTPCLLEIEPWMLSRPLHAEMKINTALWGAPLPGSGENVWRFQLYTGEPVFRLKWNKIVPLWRSQGRWENDLHHAWEADRGYTSTEDVFIPGRFGIKWDGDKELSFSIEIEWETHAPLAIPATNGAQAETGTSNDRSFSARLRTAARAYSTGIREAGAIAPSLIAGFPWFGPWGRDTMISVPGYALATGRNHQAFAIMAAMGRRIREALHAGYVGGPHLSHRTHASVNLHGVDTPFLYIWALEKLEQQGQLTESHAGTLRELACEILNSLSHGAFPGVEITAEGAVLLEKGVWAPTWMDARIGNEAVTPRQGMPIEINALFANALSYLLEREDEMARLPERLRELAQFTPKTIASRYWKGELGYFCDTLGEGADDTKLRPNQLWLMALGRLDVNKEHATRALELIQKELLTPVGLRTLSPRDSAYRGRCEGDQRTRDLAYHQGTVWPWLLGVYGDALVRFQGVDAAKSILAPTLKRLETHTFAEGCLGHVSEIFDGDEPFHARGAPAQAWSVMELFRLLEAVKS